ncbi:MAG: PQQ-binding-like beta-propeller repeat protein [Solidesulfovibrio sp.]|uniref:outer membrane protein assembly factor BamB family protein n=1 Tax=Solidesulfovibrio sp. TaxID=2910990 RepID=UPI002B21EAF4|nr:PQQ-binding-like beta-propeller repeat protein [Solidesulfovibrio sp.]MEA4855854.1 PQQ-binding-like beta-propeller repeat protein [Solidesulfovibrio sp.]
MVKGILTSILALLSCFLPVTGFSATGDYLWSGDIGGDKATWSTPLLFNNSIIVQGQDGGITALRADTGQQVWYNSTTAGDTTSPILFDNNVYMIAGSHVYKIAPATGAILADRSLTGTVYGQAPAASGQLLFFIEGGESAFTLHAASLASLEDIWTKPLGAAMASVLTDGTNLYVLADTLTALDPLTGNQRWSVPPPDGYDYFNAGSLADRTLVAFAAKQWDSGNVLAAWSLGDGSAAPGLAWTQDFGTGMTDGSPPAIDGGRVYANSRAGVLRAFTLASGSPLWTYTVRNTDLAPALPTAVDGKVYIQLFVGPPTMLCLDGATGAVAWQTPRSMSTAWSQPAIKDGRVYLATDWSGVFAFAAGHTDSIWPMFKNNPALTGSSDTPAPNQAIAPVDLLLLGQ